MWPGYRVEPLKREPVCPPRFLSFQAGGAHLTFDSMVANDDGLFNFARPLASRRGLLLVRVMLLSPVDVHGFGNLHLAVCCPLIGKRRTHLLPPPPFKVNNGFYDCNLTGCALLTDEDNVVVDDLDRQQRQPTFQVVLNYFVDDEGVYVCTYSSATDGWSAPIRCHQASYFKSCGPFAGAVARGTVHWIYTDETSFYTLNVSMDMANVSMTRIPINVPADRRVPFPCVNGVGELSFVNIQDHGALELWTKQGQDDDHHGREAADAGGWMCSDLISLPRVEKISLVFFAERRGALLVEQDGAFFTIDLKSREKEVVDVKSEEMERVGMRWFPAFVCSSSWCSRLHSVCLSRGRTFLCGHNNPVLYEADWVFDGAYMSSTSCRLGGKMRSD